jgi:hypothetical protein
MAEIKVEEVVELYASLARRMYRKFEYIVYVSAGEKSIPRWGAMAVPHARRIHARIRDVIRPYARNQIMIDDFWLRLKRDLPKICETYDQGYHFGYDMANSNPIENLARRHVFATQLYDFMSIARYVMMGLAYEWQDVYGMDRAPPAPVRIIQVTNKTFGLTVPRRPVSGAFPMGAQRNQKIEDIITR